MSVSEAEACVTRTVELAALLRSLEARIARLEASKVNSDEALDSTFMVITGILVWIMSAGFCFLEMGSVRYKNTQNVLIKNIVAPVLAFLCWYVTGFGLAFGHPKVAGGFAGGTRFVMDGFWNDKSLFRRWFFQGCFCDTSASIVSGAVAERMTLLGFAVHTVFLTSLIYPLAVFWAWSGHGWLNYVGHDGLPRSVAGPAYLDWAGSGVIHLVGGVAALCGALVVGPRKGRFDGGYHEEKFAPHSIPFTVLGAFILWFGWYGFNPGCIPHMHTANMAYNSSLVAVNTTLAPSAAGLVALVLRASIAGHRRLDVPAFCNGVLAGCVAITGASGYVYPWEALIIGTIGGLLYVLSAELMPRLQIDDPIDALSVHLVNGLWGALAPGFFGDPEAGFGGNGVFHGGDQLKVQVVAVVVFVLWSGCTSLAVFVPMRVAGLLRWSDQLQDTGADEIQHTPKKSYSATKLSAVYPDPVHWEHGARTKGSRRIVPRSFVDAAPLQLVDADADDEEPPKALPRDPLVHCALEEPVKHLPNEAFALHEEDALKFLFKVTKAGWN